MTPARLESSLSTKLLWLIILLSLVLVLFTSAVEVAKNRRDLVATEQREAAAAVSVNSPALALALWSLDQRALATSANGLVSGTSIVRVEVLEGDEVRVTAHRAGLRADYSWEAPLYRPGTDQHIGTLRIFENYESVISAVRARAVYLIAVELGKVAALAAVLFFVIRRWLTQPLSQLAARVSDSKVLETEDPIVLNRAQIGGYDELDALVDAVNATNRERRRLDAEKNLMQSRELRSGKIQALGQMAGGVAHDFNNILGAILGFARLLAEDVPRHSPQQHFVQRILAACDRGKLLVEQVLTFARGGGLEKKRLDLRQVVHSCEAVLAGMFNSNTRVSFHYSEKELPVFGTEARLGQLVSNLCLNADEALGGQPGKVIVDMGRISRGGIEHVKAETPNERMSGAIGPARRYVYLRVSDTGEGIAPAALDRIYEPFFTTKGRERGTGLGLPVVHGVVEAHDGIVHVHSMPGEGTTFSIYIPMSEEPPAPPGSTALTGESLHGHERVMILDDDADIADALAMGLTRLGYDAVAVNDPVEALEALREDPHAFDAVVTDQVMPGMRGLDLVTRLKAIRPEIKILLCTGYSDNISEGVALAAGANCFHIKPLDAATLAASLRRAFDAPGG